MVLSTRGSSALYYCSAVLSLGREGQCGKRSSFGRSNGEGTDDFALIGRMPVAKRKPAPRKARAVRRPAKPAADPKQEIEIGRAHV